MKKKTRHHTPHGWQATSPCIPVLAVKEQKEASSVMLFSVPCQYMKVLIMRVSVAGTKQTAVNKFPADKEMKVTLTRSFPLWHCYWVPHLPGQLQTDVFSQKDSLLPQPSHPSSPDRPFTPLFACSCVSVHISHIFIELHPMENIWHWASVL